MRIKPEGKKLPRCDTLSQACDDAGTYDQKQFIRIQGGKHDTQPTGKSGG
jgi:hypothetical protein